MMETLANDGRDRLVAVHVEPALTAPLLRPAVPAHAEYLQSPVRTGQQILLQRVDAEHVTHFEVRELSVRALGSHHELLATSGEACGDALMGELGVVEVPEHGRSRRFLHRQIVIRASPRRGLFGVAGAAGRAADVGIAFGRRRMRRACERTQQNQREYGLHSDRYQRTRTPPVTWCSSVLESAQML